MAPLDFGTGRVRSPHGIVAVRDADLPSGRHRAVNDPKSAMNDSRGSGTILVVEDDALLRRTYERTLEQAGYEVVSAGSVTQARECYGGTREFVAAVVDYRLPDGTALAVVQELIDRSPLCRSVVVTGTAEAAPASESARVGAHAYLRKPATPPVLLDAVRRTTASTWEWREALRHAIDRGEKSEPPPVVFDMRRAMARLKYIAGLSPASTITAWRLLWGDSNRRIAEILGCTERTVKFHVTEVLSRTGARSRAGLLRVLLEDAGIPDPWAERTPDSPGEPPGAPLDD